MAISSRDWAMRGTGPTGRAEGKFVIPDLIRNPPCLHAFKKVDPGSGPG
jgi:hypothetical protein